MKIAIDIDEVLRELIGGFCEYYNKNYGGNISPPEFKTYSIGDALGLPREESHKLLDEYCLSKDFESVNLVPYVKEVIPILKKSHELVAITAAPAWMKEINLNFFDKNFPGMFSDLIFSGEHYEENLSKTKDGICKGLGVDLIIEDSLFSEDYAKNGLKVLLLDKPWNRNISHENIIRCMDWKEILSEIRRKK